MSSRIGMLLVLAVVTAGISLQPGVAFAGGGGGSCSACSIYTEQPPTSTGNTGGKAKPTSTTGTTTPSVPAVVQLPKAAVKALKHIPKKSGRLLESYATLTAQGAEGGFSKSQSREVAGVSSPSALGAALDLGAGPTALLIALLGGVALGVGGSAFRRHRQH